LFARYASATRQGLDEETVSQIHLPEAARNLEPREALAVRFAEKFATDFRSIDAAFKAELREHFDDAEIAELGMMIGQYIAIGRLLVITGGHQAAREIYVPDS
jgi:alkylhydroperoxidase family enzyme